MLAIGCRWSGFWLRLSPLEQIIQILADTGRYWQILADTGRYWQILADTGRYWPREREPRRSSINSSACPSTVVFKKALGKLRSLLFQNPDLLAHSAIRQAVLEV